MEGTGERDRQNHSWFSRVKHFKTQPNAKPETFSVLVNWECNIHPQMLSGDPFFLRMQQLSGALQTQCRPSWADKSLPLPGDRTCFPCKPAGFFLLGFNHLLFTQWGLKRCLFLERSFPCTVHRRYKHNMWLSAYFSNILRHPSGAAQYCDGKEASTRSAQASCDVTSLQPLDKRTLKTKITAPHSNPDRMTDPPFKFQHSNNPNKHIHIPFNSLVLLASKLPLQWPSKVTWESNGKSLHHCW